MFKLLRYFLYSFILCFCFYSVSLTKNTLSISKSTTSKKPCVNYFVVFARGSGEELHTNIDHQAFQKAINEIFQKLPNFSYQYYQLGESKEFGDPYPAIGIENPRVISGAILSGGEAYEFGKSVKTGINEMIKLYQSITKSCPHTNFILSGYSQGAMVMTYAIRHFDPDKILYLANFGDPKLFLPEGKGLKPDACQKLHLSSYRQNVPDCYVEHGILGGLDPYIYKKYQHKVGAWCNIADFICGSAFDPLGLSDPTQDPKNGLFAKIFNGHVSYSRRGAYSQAAKIIYQKITKQIEDKKSKNTEPLIHYYHPSQLSIDPSFPSLYQHSPDTKKRIHQKSELVIMLPTFPTDPGDARDYLLLNQLFDKSYNQHFEIHLYLYGFFPVDIPDSPIYFPQKLDQNASKNYKQGVRYILSVDTSVMSGMNWDQVIKIMRRKIHNPPNINLPNLINTSLFDVIKNTPWREDSNHLLFMLTPNQDTELNYTNSSTELTRLIDQQIKQKELSAFIYNFNKPLHKHFFTFNNIDPKQIFDITHSPDQIIQKVLYSSQKLQLNQIIKPRFDSLDLSYSDQDFSLQKNKYTPNKQLPKTPHTYLTRDVFSHPPFQWSITQDGKNHQFQTNTPNLKISTQSLSPQKIQLTDHNNKKHQTDLIFLPKPSIHMQDDNILLSTVFPYRLIIIDDYIAGFTNQKHLTFKNVDPDNTHTIREVEFSSLGRILKQKTTIIPKQNKSKTIDKKTSINSPQVTPPSSSNHKQHSSQSTYLEKEKQLIYKLPNCGTKISSPLREIKYFISYFY